MSACAATGPGYPEVTTSRPLAAGDSRLVFLRPKDRDDGANGGAATVRVDEVKTGELAYGGFFLVDHPPGPHVVRVSGRYLAFGSCALQLETAPGETVYLDVGPRTSYMVASVIGSALGGLVGAALTPAPVLAPGEAVVASGGMAAVAAGSVAGTAAGVAAESRGLPCGGPLKFDRLGEEEALARLEGLAWSK